MTTEPRLPRRTPSGVAYTVLGERGPYLLAVHGGPGMDHAIFRPWLDPLADVVRLVYFDLPGNGQSDAPADWSLEAMADAVDGLRAHLGAKQAIVLGSSYGGFVSLVHALRHPRSVAGLILVDTAASYGFRAESLEVAQQRGTPEMLAALDRLWSGVLATDEEFHHDWRTIFPLYFHRAPRAEIDRLADETTYRLAARKAILPTFRDYDLRDRLGEIACPALVVAGRHDWITAVSQAESLAAGLPHGRLIVFEESGHMPFVEEPDRFLPLVREWLAASFGASSETPAGSEHSETDPSQTAPARTEERQPS